MSHPEFITFTGPDDQTKVEDLKAFARDFPKTEFAILFSTKRAGSERYPSAPWIQSIAQTELKLAAHFCGAIAEEVVIHGRTLLDTQLAGFKRIQINTSSEVDIDRMLDWQDRVSSYAQHPIDVILQCRGDFPEDHRLSWLYDVSGGTGTQPELWPGAPRDHRVAFGYAGGMGPDNVQDILQHLPYDRSFWIDMESKIRTDGAFCLKKCEAVYTLAF